MKYFICVTNRVGSTWLCSMLASTGVAGNPAEYFTLSQQQWLDFPQRYAALLQQDPLGVKAAHAAVQRATECLGPAEFRQTHCIWLRRRDTLGQAISNYRAMLTGQWLARPEEQVACPTRPPDQQAILDLKHHYEHCNKVLWPAWFKSMDIQPLSIWYEQLCVAPEDTVRQACRFLGLPAPSQIDTRRTKIQRDQINQRWRQTMQA